MMAIVGALTWATERANTTACSGRSPTGGESNVERARGGFLLVEDDAVVARSLTKGITAYGDTTLAGTAAAAVTVLSTQPQWSALLIDIGLPDGSGLDVLARARSANIAAPALVLTGSEAAACINRAYDLHAEYVVKPVPVGRITSFICRAVQASHRTAAVIEDWGTRCDLSAAERNILLRATLGESRGAIAAARDVSLQTLKTQVKAMLRKTGSDSLQVAVAEVLREVAGL